METDPLVASQEAAATNAGGLLTLGVLVIGGILVYKAFFGNKYKSILSD